MLPDASINAPLGFLLAAAARKLAKFYAGALKDGPVTPSQLHFLRQLWIEDGLALNEVGSRAQLDGTSATWLADQLEDKGLIERRRTRPDRRVVRVWLTDAGHDLRAAIEPEIGRWESALAETLDRHHSREELEIFRRVLATVVDELPEGDDLWEDISRAWDTSLAELRSYLETEDDPA